MAAIEDDVLTTFIAQLTASGEVPGEVTARLADALGQDRLPKVDDLVALYAQASGEAQL